MLDQKSKVYIFPTRVVKRLTEMMKWEPFYYWMGGLIRVEVDVKTAQKKP